VIIESNANHYFAEGIYNDIQQDERLFPTIEFSGFDLRQRSEALSPIFNQDQMTSINAKLHKSIYFLNIFTE
jgi:hypothetical protein